VKALRRVAARALGVIAATASLGCGAAPAQPPKPRVAAGLQVRAPHDGPRLVLLEREGDPEAALAVALAGEFDAATSAALEGLLAARLRKAGVVAELTGSATGLVLALRVADAAKAAEHA
jgi:hypothetical protein